MHTENNSSFNSMESTDPQKFKILNRGGSRIPRRRGRKPWGGGANIWFCQILRKTAWNWENFGPWRGAPNAPPPPPINPPLLNLDWKEWNLKSLIIFSDVGLSLCVFIWFKFPLPDQSKGLTKGRPPLGPISFIFVWRLSGRGRVTSTSMSAVYSRTMRHESWTITFPNELVKCLFCCKCPGMAAALYRNGSQISFCQ